MWSLFNLGSSYQDLQIQFPRRLMISCFFCLRSQKKYHSSQGNKHEYIFKHYLKRGFAYFMEKIEEGIKSKGSDTKGLRRKIVDWAKTQALHHHKQEESGEPHSSLGYTIAKKLIFSKVGMKYPV